MLQQLAHHAAWMARASAVALGTGVQSLPGAAWMGLVGEPGAQVRALLMGAGWIIPLALVQWHLSGRSSRLVRPNWRLAT